MSYMDRNFACSSEVQELSFEEIEDVSGGLEPLIHLIADAAKLAFEAGQKIGEAIYDATN